MIIPESTKVYGNLEIWTEASITSAGVGSFKTIEVGTSGIKFPSDAFGGGGDTAGMRLVNKSGEAQSLEIYTTNDADDWVNLSVPDVNAAKVNGYTIWNAANLTQTSFDNWNSTYSSVNSTSANWNTAYNKVITSRIAEGVYNANDSLTMAQRNSFGVSFGRIFSSTTATDTPELNHYFSYVLMPETPGANSQTSLAISNTNHSSYVGRGGWNSVMDWDRIWTDYDFSQTNVNNWNTAYSSLGNYLPLSGGTLTGNLQILAGATGWGEGIRVVAPAGSWGGLRLTRANDTVSRDGNWAIGYANNSTGDLEFHNYYNGNQHICAKFLNAGGVDISETLTANKIITTNNGNGENFRVGDDAWIGDVNVANTIWVKGITLPGQGYVGFGSDSNKLGYNQTSLNYGGRFDVTQLRAGTSTFCVIASTTNTDIWNDQGGSYSVHISNGQGFNFYQGTPGARTPIAGINSNGTINSQSLTTSRVVVSDGSKNFVSSTVTTTELGYLVGTSANIQNQLTNLSATTSTKATYSNGADNRIATFTNASNLAGETALTFDGTTLGVGLSANINSPVIIINQNPGQAGGGEIRIGAAGILSDANSGKLYLPGFRLIGLTNSTFKHQRYNNTTSAYETVFGIESENTANKDVTFRGDYLTISATNPRLVIDGPVGNSKGIRFNDAGSIRWYTGTLQNNSFVIQDVVVNDFPVSVLSGATGTVTIGTSTRKINIPNLTTSAVVVTDGSKNLVSSSITTTELGYLAGTSANIQTQLSTLSASKADKTVTITAGTGLAGGGNLSTNRTISLATTGTAGTYTKVTTNAYGQVTAGATLTSADVPTLGPSKISQDASNRFVTDTEKANWNIGYTSAHNHPNKANLDLINQSLALSASPIFDSIHLSANGSGDNIRVGDDALIGDINVSHTLGIRGVNDATKGYIKFGSDSNAFGYDGTSLVYTGTAKIGIVSATSVSAITSNAQTFRIVEQALTTYPSALPPYSISQTMGTNDQWRIYGEGGSNAGAMFIETGDGGTESINLAFRQSSTRNTAYTFNPTTLSAPAVTATFNSVSASPTERLKFSISPANSFRSLLFCICCSFL